MLTELITLLLTCKDTSEYMYSWIYAVIDLNFERTKIFANSYITSSFGFIMNVVAVLLKIFFEDRNLRYSDFVFEIIKEIDFVYCLTTHPLNFSKHERFSSDEITKEYIDTYSLEVINKEKYNDKTKLFFLTHILMFYVVKTFDEEYTKIINRISEMMGQGAHSDS